MSAGKAAIEGLGGALVGIGLERFGFEEFAEGNFFDGPVYIDESKAVYKELFRRNSLWNGFGLLNRKVWAAKKAVDAAVRCVTLVAIVQGAPLSRSVAARTHCLPRRWFVLRASKGI